MKSNLVLLNLLSQTFSFAPHFLIHAYELKLYLNVFGHTLGYYDEQTAPASVDLIKLKIFVNQVPYQESNLPTVSPHYLFMQSA